MSWRGAEQTADVLGTFTGDYTTPEAPELQRSLAKIRMKTKNGLVSKSLLMPLSLIGLKEWTSEATVFTNLSPEHLDFHEDMEAYFEPSAGYLTLNVPLRSSQ